MSNQYDGGPAFPHPGTTSGMTLRDYFAAKAMQACIPHRRVQFETDNEDLSDWDEFFGIAANEAYRIADAMLKERAPKEGDRT
jgi:hypothetical protein